jgi:5-formyltetrahydrofolate cyclo-ligase
MAVKLSKTEILEIVDAIQRKHQQALREEKELFEISKAEKTKIEKAVAAYMKLPDWLRKEVQGFYSKSKDTILNNLIDDVKNKTYKSKLPKLKSKVDLILEVRWHLNNTEIRSVEELINEFNPYVEVVPTKVVKTRKTV